MDSLIAISGRDFVLMASDVTSARSIVVMKEDMDKIMELDEHKLLGFAGEPGDCTAFTEYIQKNVHLFALRSGITLDTHAVGNFTRNELAVALRYVRSSLFRAPELASVLGLVWRDRVRHCQALLLAPGAPGQIGGPHFSRPWATGVDFEGLLAVVAGWALGD